MRISKLNYVDKAENTMRGLKKTRKNSRNRDITPVITTSKIRSILSMVSEIYNDTIHSPSDELSDDMCSRVQYLKMRIAYEAGRDENVWWFVKDAEIIELINEIGKSKENLILFCHYMEALVAYHRYLGGKDY